MVYCNKACIKVNKSLFYKMMINSIAWGTPKQAQFLKIVLGSAVYIFAQPRSKVHLFVSVICLMPVISLNFQEASLLYKQSLIHVLYRACMVETHIVLCENSHSAEM